MLSTLLTNLHDQSVHVMKPIFQQFSDTQCVHALLCTDIAVCISCVCGAFTSLLQARVLSVAHQREFWLEPVAPGSRVQAQTTGYFNWSRVGSQNRVFCRSRLWEPALGIGSRFRNRRLWVPDSLKEWNRGSDSQFGIWENRGTGRTAQAYCYLHSWSIIHKQTAV